MIAKQRTIPMKYQALPSAHKIHNIALATYFLLHHDKFNITTA